MLQHFRGNLDYWDPPRSTVLAPRRGRPGRQRARQFERNDAEHHHADGARRDRIPRPRWTSIRWTSSGSPSAASSQRRSREFRPALVRRAGAARLLSTQGVAGMHGMVSEVIDAVGKPNPTRRVPARASLAVVHQPANSPGKGALQRIFSGRADQLPTILGFLLVLLATVAVGHAIVLAVRRRQRDLAVLRTLGFQQSQVRTTVACQASTYAVLSLLVGIPLGIESAGSSGANRKSLGVVPRSAFSVRAGDPRPRHAARPEPHRRARRTLGDPHATRDGPAN